MTGPGFGHMRTSPAERDLAMDVLKAAYAEGRLEHAELVDRIGRVQVSRTYAELAELTADIPVGPYGVAGTAPLFSTPPPAPPATPARTAPAGRRQVSGLALGALVTAILVGPAAMLTATAGGGTSAAHGDEAALAVASAAVLMGVAALVRIGPAGQRGRIVAVAGIVVALLVVRTLLS
jgi:hypothetical protein